MHHKDKNKKFGRERKVRTGFLRSLARNLVLNGRIITTEARAKAIRPIVEKMVTCAKQDTVANRRLISARLGNDAQATKKLFEMAPTYASRQGGYLRIVRVAVRPGDGAVRAYIGFV